MCGLSLKLVLSLAPRGFSPGTPVFPSLQKPTPPNSNSIWNARTRLNEFIWTPKCFVGKQAIYNFYTSLIRTPFSVRIRENRLYSASYISSILFNWLLGIINNFGSIFCFSFCLRSVNWIHWKASSTTNISTREIRCESFCASSITSAFYNLNPGYNFPFIHCFSLHVDSNSPDVTEKSVNGLAPCETFRWSVVRAPRRYCLREIRSTTEIEVVARHQYGISVLVPLTSFPGVTKSQVFSHARSTIVD